MGNETMTSRWQKFRVLAFFLILAGPLSVQIFRVGRNTRGIDMEEKRKLASLPTLSLSGAGLKEYPKAYEKYFNDNFYFRVPLLRMNSLARFYGLRVSTNTDAISRGLELSEQTKTVIGVRIPQAIFWEKHPLAPKNWKVGCRHSRHALIGYALEEFPLSSSFLRINGRSTQSFFQRASKKGEESLDTKRS